MPLDEWQVCEVAILWRQQFTEVRFQPGGHLSGRPVRAGDRGFESLRTEWRYTSKAPGRRAVTSVSRQSRKIAANGEQRVNNKEKLTRRNSSELADSLRKTARSGKS